jgi:hypothetical protein
LSRAAPRGRRKGCGVKELLRTTEPVFLSWALAVLKAEGIASVVLDGHTSVLEGSTNAIPRRLMVADEDNTRARQILTDAGEGDRLAKKP